MADNEGRVPEQPTSDKSSRLGFGDRIVGVSGYLLIGASVLSFAVIAYLKVMQARLPTAESRFESWLDLAQHEGDAESPLDRCGDSYAWQATPHVRETG